MSKRFDVMAELDGRDLYAINMEKFAPQPLDCSHQEATSVMWVLRSRDEALAMAERLRAAGAEARVYEVPPDETGDEDWIPSADGLTLVPRGDADRR